MADEAWTLDAVQRRIALDYGAKDAARGPEATFLWFVAEVGELAEAVRSGTPEERAGEFADALAWLATLANLMDVDLASAFGRKYGQGCSRCGASPCGCPPAGKP